jgi:hypothetical protein
VPGVATTISDVTRNSMLTASLSAKTPCQPRVTAHRRQP